MHGILPQRLQLAVEEMKNQTQIGEKYWEEKFISVFFFPFSSVLAEKVTQLVVCTGRHREYTR